MDLKYTIKDTEKLLDVFSNIQEKKETKNIKLVDLEPLLNYPNEVLEEFLKCMCDLDTANHTETYIKEHYDAIMAYVTMRLNFV